MVRSSSVLSLFKYLMIERRRSVVRSGVVRTQRM
jgi:hypothetical protein